MQRSDTGLNTMGANALNRSHFFIFMRLPVPRYNKDNLDLCCRTMEITIKGGTFHNIRYTTTVPRYNRRSLLHAVDCHQ